MTATADRRHASYVTHSQHDILTQRVYQIASGYEDGNDCTALRHDPMFRLGSGRAPFNDEAALASASTISRFEHAARRRDIFRLSSALVDQFISGYATAPAVLVLDIDHTQDQAHGQQPFAFCNHHYGSTCYLPLVIFEGLSGALVAAVLRSSMRPTGAENTMILKRVLERIRRHFPDTHILVRGDGHFSTPELMDCIDARSTRLPACCASNCAKKHCGTRRWRRRNRAPSLPSYSRLPRWSNNTRIA